MLDIKFIRENKEKVQKNCENRGTDCDIEKLLLLDERRKNLLQYIEELQAEKNKLNDLIQRADSEERKELIEQGKAVKEKISKSEPEFEYVSKNFNEILLKVPNLT